MLSKESLARVKRLEIVTRRKVGHFFAGNYASVFRGQGMTFSEVRPYQWGDDVRRIDWNVSARMNQPFIKQFVEERELTIVLAIDVSASQRLGSRGQSKLELTMELAALFSFCAISNNDKVSMLAFSDRTEEFVPPRKGRKHVMRLMNDIVTLSPKGKLTHFHEAFETLNHTFKRRSVVIVISDFIALKESPELKTLALRHDVVPIWIRDPIEQALPDLGFTQLQDLETGTLQLVDTSSVVVRRAYQARMQQAQMRISEVFRQSGLRPLSLNNGEDYTKPLLAHFRART